MNAKLARKLWQYDRTTGCFWWRERGRGRQLHKSTGTWRTSTGYIELYYHGKCYGAHRIAWLIVKGCFPKDQIDHRNSNRADNRWRNLRTATHKQNRRNARIRKDSKTGFKGVKRIRKNGYAARIWVDNGHKHIGYYRTAKAAHRAYARTAKKYFGEFARTA